MGGYTERGRKLASLCKRAISTWRTAATRSSHLETEVSIPIGFRRQYQESIHGFGLRRHGPD